MPNNDLISREALLAAYDAAHKGPPGGARKLIQEAPAIDAVPVRHGRWVEEIDRENHWHCSECGTVVGIVAKYAQYCYKCGALMDGGDNDEAD